mmetsp:Transcript_39605/g.60601  ORF Transcript_39605/g.60601 Transcript_39605/m.60601 type:complete len:267 (+) Transcript_39605:1951-2751(+)
MEATRRRSGFIRMVIWAGCSLLDFELLEEFMDDGPELDEGLVLDPAVLVIESLLEELSALLELVDFVFADESNELGHVLYADFADAPDVVFGEGDEGPIDLVHEGRIVQMLGYCDKGWHQEFLDLEEHAVLDVLQEIIKELVAVFLDEDALFGELLDDYQDCDLGLLAHLFRFLVFTARRNAVHDHLDDFLHQILRLLLGNVLFRKVEQRVDALHLDGLFAEHEHARSQGEYVDSDYVDDLGLGDEVLRFEQLFEQLLQILEQLQF